MRSESLLSLQFGSEEIEVSSTTLIPALSSPGTNDPVGAFQDVDEAIARLSAALVERMDDPEGARGSSLGHLGSLALRELVVSESVFQAIQRIALLRLSLAKPRTWSFSKEDSGYMLPAIRAVESSVRANFPLGAGE